jgi:signal transduction histidine kinase
MAARIAALKGTFTAHSESASGTRIMIALPLRMRPDEDEHS